MKIQIKNIGSEGLEIDESFPLAAIGLDESEWIARRGIRTRAMVSKVHEEIHVRGRVETRLEVECGRCLAGYPLPIEGAFEVFFKYHDPTKGSLPDEPIEDLGFEYYTGQEVDLTRTLRDLVVLAVPSRRLCREDCRGLCPRCGANLNSGGCGCALEAREEGFHPFREFFRTHGASEESTSR